MVQVLSVSLLHIYKRQPPYSLSMKSSVQDNAKDKDKDIDKDKDKAMTAFYKRASLRLIVLSYQLLMVQFTLSHVDASIKICIYFEKSNIIHSS